MRQGHDEKKFIKILLFASCSIFAALAVILFAVKPFSATAESSMEINGNGVLVRYNIKDGMTQVSIPSNVRAIGNEAFMGDKTLERIYIPGNVEVIGSKAFYGCERLMEINLQDGTREIKDSAFAMCTNLSRATLPASLRTMGNGVFAGDTALSDISIDSDNRNFFINDNVIYNRDSSVLVEMVPGRQGEKYIMPFSVKSISPYAFWGADNLKSVRVSNNVSAITPFAFTNVAALEFVYLPESVDSIQEYAFRDCKKLKYVGTEGSISYIDDSAFYGIYDDYVIENNVSQQDAEAAYFGGSAKSSKKDTEQAADSADTAEKSENNTVSDDKASENEKGESVTDGGSIVFNTPWGTRAKYKEIDTSDPRLYGTGKIVGGRTVIMPTEKQDYSGVSAN